MSFGVKHVPHSRRSCRAMFRASHTTVI